MSELIWECYLYEWCGDYLAQKNQIWIPRLYWQFMSVSRVSGISEIEEWIARIIHWGNNIKIQTDDRSVSESIWWRRVVDFYKTSGKNPARMMNNFRHFCEINGQYIWQHSYCIHRSHYRVFSSLFSDFCNTDFHFPLQISIPAYTICIQNTKKDLFEGENQVFLTIYFIFFIYTSFWLSDAKVVFSTKYFYQ